MLSIIPVHSGTIALFLAIALVVAFIWIGVRAVRDSGREQESREAAEARIMRNALAKGRSVAHLDSGNVRRQYKMVPADDTIWRIQGSAPGSGGHQDGKSRVKKPDIDWTLSWRIAFREASDISSGPAGVSTRDTIQGQLLSFRCESIRRDKPAFNFYHRNNRYDKRPDEIVSEADDKLWRRWRLEAKDVALARRVFNPTLCTMLERLPLQHASNTNADERTAISLGPRGLQADLGVEELTPALVDLWIDIGETLIDRCRAP